MTLGTVALTTVVLLFIIGCMSVSLSLFQKEKKLNSQYVPTHPTQLGKNALNNKKELATDIALDYFSNEV